VDALVRSQNEALCADCSSRGLELGQGVEVHSFAVECLEAVRVDEPLEFDHGKTVEHLQHFGFVLDAGKDGCLDLVTHRENLVRFMKASSSRICSLASSFSSSSRFSSMRTA